MTLKTITPKDKIDFENESDQNEIELSKEDFLEWIKTAEKSPTRSLETFNEKWEEKKLKIHTMSHYI